MSQDIRRELIGRNLGIKPINHGQIYAFQIAIPDARKPVLSLERRQALEKSLVEHQSNLISLIVRRTEAYENEEIEYELVHGADWLQVAQDMDIGKVWAWVFDMTDEQAIATAAEMELLTVTSVGGIPISPQPAPANDSMQGTGSINLQAVMDQKLQLIGDSIRLSLLASLNNFRTEFNEKINLLNHRLDSSSRSNSLADVAAELIKLSQKIDAFQQPIKSLKRVPLSEFTGEKINLLQAADDEIRTVLQQTGTQKKQIDAAIRAIHYWKQSEQGLTWNNLKLSARKGAATKIEGFAEGTYERLMLVAEILSTD